MPFDLMLYVLAVLATVWLLLLVLLAFGVLLELIARIGRYRYFRRAYPLTTRDHAWERSRE